MEKLNKEEKENTVQSTNKEDAAVEANKTEEKNSKSESNEKKNKDIKGSVKKSFQTKKFKNGSYSTGLIAAAIIIVVVINLIVGQLPSKFTKIDVSQLKMFTLSDQTKEIASSLDQDVTIYVMASSTSADSTITEILEKYKDLSSHIKVETKDPVLYPNFASQYTDDTVSENSLIVVSGERSKVVAYNQIYQTSVDYSTYTSSTTFDGEGQITSAINYVVSEDIPVMYVLEGHDEMSISSTLSSSINKENVETRSLNLLTEGAVPEDTDCLLIAAPSTDYSEEEAQMIIEYLNNGGKALIISNYSETDLPNFDSILADYGVGISNGIILEGDSSYCLSGYPNYILPQKESHEITDPLISSKLRVLLPAAQGIERLDSVRGTVTISDLLTTSDSSYAKLDVSNYQTLEQEENDVSGPFSVGVAITEEYNEINTKLVVFSTASVLDESVNSRVSGANYDMVLNAIGWMCENESGISIRTKSLDTEYLTITGAEANTWSIVTIVVLPLVCVVIGFVIWLRRRKR